MCHSERGHFPKDRLPFSFRDIIQSLVMLHDILGEALEDLLAIIPHGIGCRADRAYGAHRCGRVKRWWGYGDLRDDDVVFGSENPRTKRKSLLCQGSFQT